MDAVEAGEVFVVTRHGIEVADVRPIQRRRPVSTRELIERHRHMPQLDDEDMRREADEFFGTEDRVGDEDPFERRRD